MTVESANPKTAEATPPREPPVAGGGVPVLGHGWKLARDPLSFMSRLRDHGVRIEAAMAHIEDVDRLRELVAEDPAKAWLR